MILLIRVTKIEDLDCRDSKYYRILGRPTVDDGDFNLNWNGL